MNAKDGMILGVVAGASAIMLIPRDKLLLWIGITGGAYAAYYFLLKPKKEKA